LTGGAVVRLATEPWLVSTRLERDKGVVS
jgi:hypothetical protein